jgi:recombination protein RecA
MHATNGSSNEGTRSSAGAEASRPRPIRHALGPSRSPHMDRSGPVSRWSDAGGLAHAAVAPLAQEAEPSRATPAPASEPLASLLPSGRLTELSGHRTSARTTTAVSFVCHAQAQGNLVAWVQPEDGPLYPPDLKAAGVDLGSLVCVHVPRRAGPSGLTKATELLLRSGAFGLVVLDLTEGAPARPEQWQGRLGGIVRERGAGLVLLTEKRADSSSLGPLVGLRVEPRRERIGPERMNIHHTILKAKGGLSGSPCREMRRTPDGLP